MRFLNTQTVVVVTPGLVVVVSAAVAVVSFVDTNKQKT